MSDRGSFAKHCCSHRGGWHIHEPITRDASLPVCLSADTYIDSSRETEQRWSAEDDSPSPLNARSVSVRGDPLPTTARALTPVLVVLAQRVQALYSPRRRDAHYRY